MAGILLALIMAMVKVLGQRLFCCAFFLLFALSLQAASLKISLVSDADAQKLVPFKNYYTQEYPGLCYGVECTNDTLNRLVDFDSSKPKDSWAAIYEKIVSARLQQTTNSKRITINGYSSDSFYKEMNESKREFSNPLVRAAETFFPEQKNDFWIRKSLISRILTDLARGYPSLLGLRFGDPLSQRFLSQGHALSVWAADLEFDPKGNPKKIDLIVSDSNSPQVYRKMTGSWNQESELSWDYEGLPQDLLQAIKSGKLNLRVGTMGKIDLLKTLTSDLDDSVPQTPEGPKLMAGFSYEGSPQEMSQLIQNFGPRQQESAKEFIQNKVNSLHGSSAQIIPSICETPTPDTPESLKDLMEGDELNDKITEMEAIGRTEDRKQSRFWQEAKASKTDGSAVISDAAYNAVLERPNPFSDSKTKCYDETAELLKIYKNNFNSPQDRKSKIQKYFDGLDEDKQEEVYNDLLYSHAWDLTTTLIPDLISGGKLSERIADGMLRTPTIDRYPIPFRLAVLKALHQNKDANLDLSTLDETERDLQSADPSLGQQRIENAAKISSLPDSIDTLLNSMNSPVDQQRLAMQWIAVNLSKFEIQVPKSYTQREKILLATADKIMPYTKISDPAVHAWTLEALEEIRLRITKAGEANLYEKYNRGTSEVAAR